MKLIEWWDSKNAREHRRIGFFSDVTAFVLIALLALNLIFLRDNDVLFWLVFIILAIPTLAFLFISLRINFHRNKRVNKIEERKAFQSLIRSKKKTPPPPKTVEQEIEEFLKRGS